MIYYRNHVYVPDVPGLRDEILHHFITVKKRSFRLPEDLYSDEAVLFLGRIEEQGAETSFRMWYMSED